MPFSPPVPIAATFSIATRLLTVTFDRQLQPGPSAIGNWPNWADLGGGNIARYLNTVPFTAAGDTVSGTTTFIAFDPGHAQVVNYNATPPDVLSTFGIPAAPFADFPLVLV